MSVRDSYLQAITPTLGGGSVQPEIEDIEMRRRRRSQDSVQLISASRLPGWLVTAWGIIQLIRWMLDWKATVEEAMSTAEELQEPLRATIQTAYSPWFGVALVVSSSSQRT